MKQSLTVASILVFGLAVMGFGQTPAQPAASTPPKALEFEVATIKPAAPMDPGRVAAGKMHVGMNVDGARVDIGFMSLVDLMQLAYKVKLYQVSGPDWMPAQRFDILAKLPEGATKDQVPEMLQALLADRFKLTLHRENKDHNVYALVVGKGGSKLKESPPDEEPPPPDAKDKDKGFTVGTGNGQSVRVTQDGKGAVMRGGENGTMRMSMGENGKMRMEISKMTMPKVAELLSRFVDRPVVDMTELTGNYQFALELSMDDLKNMARAAGVNIPGGPPGSEAPKTPADSASDPSGSSIFTAVQEFGLRLDKRKAPVEILVVDHVEKMPTEN